MISLHLIADNADPARLDRGVLYLKRVNARSVNVAGGSQIDRAMTLVDQIHDELPNIIIFWRQLEDTGIHAELSPEQWYASRVAPRLEWLQRHQVRFVTDNESSGDDARIHTYAAWQVDVMNRLHAVGLFAAIDRFATGNIGDGTEGSNQYPFLKPTFDAMIPGDYISPNEYSNAPGLSSVGHLGRYENMYRAAGRDLPTTIGEAGIAVHYDPGKGYLTVPGLTGKAYADQMIAEEVHYGGGAIDRFLYCIGGYGWESFQIGDDVLETLEAHYAATGTPPDTGDGGEELPPVTGKVDLYPYFRGDGRWYDLNHNAQMGGGWETVSTQPEAADSRIFLHQKNQQYERLCLHGGFICRDLDTSPGNNEAYRLTDGNTAWSKWCPQFMALGEKYERRPTVTFLNKSNGSQVASKPPYVDHSTIQLEKVWASYPIPENTFVIGDVIQLAFFPAGATVATERYFYAKKYGLIRWQHNDGRVSFIQHLTTTTYPLPTIEQLGAWANAPTIPPESSTPPPDQTHEFPPDSDPGWTVKEVSSTGGTTNVRAQPTTNSADVGDITTAKPYSLNEAKAVPDPKGTWIPIKGTWGNGWVASWVIVIGDEVVTEPPPVDPPAENQTFTMTATVTVLPGEDVAAIKELLSKIVSITFA